MEGHAISSPESDQSSKLISELRDSSDETAAKLARCTFGDVEVRGDVYATKAQACEKTTEEEDAVCVWDYLDNTS